MTKEKARGIQTALWAALVLVQMTVVGALQVRAETVRREVTYEAVEGEAELPDEITVSVLAGNDEELVRCRAVDQVEEDAYWRDDFSFPITFSRNKLPAITLIVYYTYCSQASNVLQTITVFQLIYTGNLFII